LDWSPDGGSILALRIRRGSTHEQELALIATADGSVRGLRTITAFWRLVKRASFSPDGRFIAFSSAREGSSPQSDVFLMAADGRNEVVVAGHPAEDHLLGWTPDGRSLVFLSDRAATWDIWTVPVAGGKKQGEPELLKKDFGYHVWDVLGFAANGSLCYKTYTSSGALYSGELDLETGKVLVPPAPVTTRYAGPTVDLTWSPDGTNLLYVSPLGPLGAGNRILTLRSAATGEERFLPPRLSFVGWPSWAPDGRSVISIGMMGREHGIFRTDTETNGLTKLPGFGLAPKLCADGKTLVFLMDGGESMRKRNLDTNEESEVAKTGDFQGFSPFDLSPDGREVVFQLYGAVKIVSLNAGEPRELFSGLAKSYDLWWTRDGRYIIAKSGRNIWRVPPQGGAPLKLDLSGRKMDFFALHPDNRRFAFSVVGTDKEELWALENFLPKEKLAGK
jgi:Tol biopolymer transport system component